jgi:hypothetical protein
MRTTTAANAGLAVPDADLCRAAAASNRVVCDLLSGEDAPPDQQFLGTAPW